jgi:hypothetical protein
MEEKGIGTVNALDLEHCGTYLMSVYSRTYKLLREKLNVTLDTGMSSVAMPDPVNTKDASTGNLISFFH